MTHAADQAVRHRVRRIVFELDAGPVRAGAPLQQRVSRFCRERLDGVLEAAFADAQPGQVHHRVEVDLGVIGAPVLERELASRLEQALRAQLAPRASEAALPPHLAARRADALRWLAHGVHSAHGTAADALAALASVPAALAALLVEAGQRPEARRRLAQLDDAVLAQAVRALEPAHAEYIIACVDGVARTPLPPPAPPGAGLRQALWEFVMTYLLVECGSRFNTLSFVASLLRQMAARFGIAYADLLALVARQAEEAPFPARASLPGVIAELQHAVPPTAPAPPGKDELEVAGCYLEFGVLDDAALYRGSAADLLARLLAERPVALAALVRRLGRRAQVRQRLAVRMSEPFLARLVQRLAPEQAPAVAATARRLQRLHAAHRFVPRDGAGFAQVLWRAMLDLLLGEPGSTFNRLSFLRAAMRALAAAHGMSYEAVLLAALVRVPDARRARPGSLAAMLLVLSDEACLGPRSVDAAMRAGAGVGALARTLRGLDAGQRKQVLHTAAQRVGIAPADCLQLADALAQAAGPARAHEAQACLWAALRQGASDRRGLLRRVLAAAGVRTGLGYAALLEAVARRLAGTGWSAHCEVLRSGQENDATHHLSGAKLARILRRLDAGRRAQVLKAAAQRADIAPADALQLAGALAQAAGSAHAHEVQACLWAALRQGASDRRGLLRRLLAATAARTGLDHAQLLAAAVRSLAGTGWTGDCAALLSEQEALAVPPPATVATSRDAPFGAALHYLTTGRLAPAANPAALVARLLAEPERAAGLLRAADPGAHVMRRLLATATRHALRALLAALAKADASALLAWLEQDGPDEAARWMVMLPALCDRHAERRPVRSLIAELEDRLARQPGIQSAPVSAAAPLPLAPREARHGLAGLRAFLQYGAGSGRQAAERFEQAWSVERDALASLLCVCAGREPERRRLAAMPAGTQRRALHLLLGLDHDAAWQCIELLERAGCKRADLFAALLAALADAPGRRFDPWTLVVTLERRGAGAFDPARLRQVDRILRASGGALPPRMHARMAAAARQLALRAPPSGAAKASAAGTDESAEQLPADVGTVVSQAGVILLWPFLQHYFRALGLIERGAFAGVAERERAVHLIQYLVSGAMDAQDEELALNKLLCGLDPSEPVAPPLPVREDEATLSGQLLYSVTQNWRQLANTSVQGLRETFLQRRGRLLRHDQGWTLHVEGSAFDVLLSTLPWGLNPVRLPWMTGLLTVEWKR